MVNFQDEQIEASLCETRRRSAKEQKSILEKFAKETYAAYRRQKRASQEDAGLSLTPNIRPPPG
jgi:hypothetical protein